MWFFFTVQAQRVHHSIHRSIMLTWYKTKMYETKRKSSIKTVRYYEYHQHTQTHMCDDCVCSWYIHLKMYASLNGGNNKWEWILVKISFCMRVVFYLQKLWFFVNFLVYDWISHSMNFSTSTWCEFWCVYRKRVEHNNNNCR